MSEASWDSGGTAHMLPNERKQASFNVNVLMEIMGSDQRAKLVETSRKLFSKAPFDGAEDFDGFRSYEDTFVGQIERTTEAVKITRDNAKFRLAHMAGKVQMADMFETNGVASIHFTMFLTFLKTNATDEQKKLWLEPATEAQYLGAYAQTELGHGSNVRGLETLATPIFGNFSARADGDRRGGTSSRTAASERSRSDASLGTFRSAWVLGDRRRHAPRCLKKKD